MTNEQQECQDAGLLNRILQALTECVCVTDEGGRIILANLAFEAMLGYEPGELTGQEGGAVFDDPVLPQQGEVRCLKKDGTTLETTARVTEDLQDGRRVLITTLRPTADGVQAQLALSVSESRSRTWLENSPVCTKIVDGDYNLRYMSTAGIKALILEEIEAFYGKPYPFSFYPDDFKQEMASNLRRAWTSGQVVEQEAAVCDVDGNELWFHSTIVPVSGDGGAVEYLIVVSLETTQRKQAEQALLELNRDLEGRIHVRTAQLEQANEELEGFVRSASHDLRAPLRTVKTFTQLIERKFGGDLGEEASELFGFILDGVAQMDELVQELLAYSQLGREAVSLKAISLDAVFDRAIETLASQIEQTGARVRVDRPLPAAVGNQALATHAVINILENAIKYRKPDTAPAIEVSQRCENSRVVISIADNGIGIDPEHQGQIFAAFRRLHSQAEIPGTGIGLASVQKALEIMGGEIAVSSEPGSGSTFRMELPAS